MGRPDDIPFSYPSVLTVLGRDREQQWREDAQQHVQRAENSLTDRSTFGPTPPAEKFATVYAAALAEYTATLKGIKDDLVIAAENLALAADEIRSRDEDAGAAFTTLLSRWTDTSGFSSDQRQDEARRSEDVQQGAQTMAGLQQDAAGEPGAQPQGGGQGGAPDGGQPQGGEPSSTMATGPGGQAPTGPGPNGVA